MEMRNIRVVDSVFDPYASSKSLPTVRYAASERDYRYQVWIYLEGLDLPFVKEVLYQLPNSFTPQEYYVQRTIDNPNCRIAIWTGVAFTVDAILKDIQGNLVRLIHPEIDFIRELKQYSNIHYMESRLPVVIESLPSSYQSNLPYERVVSS
jgi:hypothetical protein